VKRNRYSHDEQSLRRLLREARLAKHLTQSELAEKLGTPQSFVSKYESGERLLSFVDVVTICRLLQLDPVKLMNNYLRNHET